VCLAWAWLPQNLIQSSATPVLYLEEEEEEEEEETKCATTIETSVQI